MPNSNSALFEREAFILQSKICSGEFGNNDDFFMTTRDLAQKRGISLVTAHQVMKELCNSGYIELRGKKYYITGNHKMLSSIMTNDLGENLIGILIPQVENSFYSSLSDAVVNSALINGYRSLIMKTNYSPEEEAKALQIFSDFKVAGVISCVPPVEQNRGLYECYSLPYILLGQNPINSNISSVQVNSLPISQKIAKHLVEEGYRKFLYVSTNNIDIERDVRFIGYKMELQKMGYCLMDKDIYQISYDEKENDEIILNVLSQQMQPVGIFCHHDLLAARVYHVCYNLGKKIPSAVGIVGFDDLPSIARYLSLTTAHYNISAMAEMAVNLLISSMYNPMVSYNNYYIDPTLIIRRSSKLSKVNRKMEEL